MNSLYKVGRYLYPLSFLLYVGLHLGKPEVGAQLVPDYFPAPLFWNYFTAICILAFIVSAVIGKYDRLAYSAMALYVFLMCILVHLPRAMGHELVADTSMAANLAREMELEMVNVFRNTMVTGALLAFAGYVARDKRGLGKKQA